TGLAAADRLLDLGGCDVTVLEAEPDVGGLASTVALDDVATDIGPHRIHTELPEVQDLLPELLGDRLVRVERSSRMLLDGRWISYPLRLGETVCSLGWRKAARFAAAMVATRIGELVLPSRKITFEDALRSRFGSAACEAVFRPYAQKVWRRPPSQLSAEVARVRLPEQGVLAVLARLFSRSRKPRTGPLREFLYVRGGIGELSKQLAERIHQRGGRIFLQTRATGFELSDRSDRSDRSDASDRSDRSDFQSRSAPRSIRAVLADQLGKAISLSADAVISTIPLPTLGEMLPASEERARELLTSLECLSIILVVLVIKRERVGRDHWLYFPQTPPLPTRVYEPKNFDPSLAAAGKTCICCEITATRTEPLWARSDDEIAAQVRSEIVATGLVSDGEIVYAHVIRKDWAYPIYALGFQEKLQVAWRALVQIPNLVTTGRQGLFNHNNIDHCLVMGRRAAELVAASDRPATAWYGSLGQFASFRILD
ncbi:FAD-dependent oxidoreductase, partial [Candidatus Sumerlaeota bacterium]|nr:FAD-dependent oxidoreductase [Candidatus Sumerlaeota bacterium]